MWGDRFSKLCHQMWNDPEINPGDPLFQQFCYGANGYTSAACDGSQLPTSAFVGGDLNGFNLTRLRLTYLEIQSDGRKILKTVPL
jgi:hypothetical protein